MAVATASPVSAPSPPDACEHASPVLGVMAHEFSCYDGAQGPEGTRRTVTYYGPVLGGLPISAWHCEECGLLRLDYPDGRTEERRLYPGPQPGLLVAPSTENTDWEHYGMQSRVSGVSAPPRLLAQAEEAALERARSGRSRPIALPAYGAVGWATVVMLAFVAGGLLLAGVLAAALTSTPDVETPIVGAVGAVFAAWLSFVVGAATLGHFLPSGSLQPSIAVRERGRPVLDGSTKAAVALLSVTGVGLLTAALLASVPTSTPEVEPYVVAITAVSFAGALMALLAGFGLRHRRGPAP